MALAIIVVLFMGSHNMVKADGCDAYNGPVGIHSDPDRYYPVNLAFTECADADYSDPDMALEGVSERNEREGRGERYDRDRDRTYSRVDYRENDEYDSDNQRSSDSKLAHEIRRALRHDRSLSSDAQNVGVHVRNGVVTLRGAVDTRAERRRVCAKAQHIAGEDNVYNHLSVLQQ